MDRKQYNECVGEGLRGKKFSPGERRKEFCVLSKTCSRKASSREEAERMCEASLSQPREHKPRKGHRAVANQGGMRLILLTTSDCGPCAAAKQYLKDKLDKGLIVELNIQRSNEAADLVAKYGFTSVPKLLVLDDEGKPFSELQITDTEQTL